MDVILFVTRLDDGRAARCDRIILHDLLNLFGEAALGKLVFVLSRGMSLPPADLHWEEWVHGRVELLHTYVCDVFPAVVVSGSVVEMDARTREMQRYEEELPDAPEGLMAVCKAIVNDDDTDEGSVSNVPSNFVDLLFDAAVDRTDTREFEDVTCPEAVVVEMGEGGDVLEDGTEWFPRLVEVIGEIARRTKELERKERERIMKEREENVGTEEEHGVFQKAQQVVAHLKRDSRMLLVGELVILVMVLCLGGIVENIGKRRQRRKRKESIDEDDDILLSISDEEYEQLTRPDPGSGGMVVLEGAGEEDEDDKELGEDEADFFGEVRSNK